ncbi:MAG: septum formation protein [Patiriisocius sp.]|jgi:septum formation protein
MMVKAIPIVLASTSIYRKALLEKLGLRFVQVDPNYEELFIQGESPAIRALRLATGKSKAAAMSLPTDTDRNTIVIGSDQVAHFEDQILSKPGNFENAYQQLTLSSGKWVTFVTAVCLSQPDGTVITCFDEEYRLKFRDLGDTLIRDYLKLEQPYDCAGSIKAEAHGILLIEDSSGKDINTLYGLPLMRLATALLQIGVTLPSVNLD